jgi:hypothetical protein
LRFSSPSVLAGHARAARGGRPPDDPASAFGISAGPRSLRCEPVRRDASPLRFYAVADNCCDEARVADACLAGAFQPNPSLASFGPVRAAGHVPKLWRRVDGLLLASPYVVDRSRGCDRGNRSNVVRHLSRLATGHVAGPVCATHRTHAAHASRSIRPLERLRYKSAARSRVIRQIAPSSRGVPLPASGIARPGRTTQVFPSAFAVRRRSWGSRSLRRFTPACG